MPRSAESAEISFWKWLVGKAPYDAVGASDVLNWWLLLHVAIGVAIAWASPLGSAQAASVVLLPLAGVLIGLSFAWAGSALSILQTDEIGLLSRSTPEGLDGYVHSYQLSILLLLVTAAAWGVAGLGVGRLLPPADTGAIAAAVRFGGKASLYALSSVALRECWSVVSTTGYLLIAQIRVREALERKRSRDRQREQECLDFGAEEPTSGEGEPRFRA